MDMIFKEGKDGITKLGYVYIEHIFELDPWIFKHEGDNYPLQIIPFGENRPVDVEDYELIKPEKFSLYYQILIQRNSDKNGNDYYKMILKASELEGNLGSYSIQDSNYQRDENGYEYLMTDEYIEYLYSYSHKRYRDYEGDKDNEVLLTEKISKEDAGLAYIEGVFSDRYVD